MASDDKSKIMFADLVLLVNSLGKIASAESDQLCELFGELRDVLQAERRITARRADDPPAVRDQKG